MASSTSSSSSSSSSRPYHGNLQLAQTFVNMMDPIELKTVSRTLDIGRVLYAITWGDQVGLDLWARCYPEIQHETYWSFKDQGVTLATLADHARRESPKAYKKWHRNWCQEVEIATSYCQYDVAQLIYRHFWLDLCYVTKGLKGNWFYLNQGHLVELSDAAVIKMVFTALSADGWIHGVVEEKLKSVVIRHRVLKEMKEFMVVPEINLIRDTYRGQTLFPVANGVLEICQSEIVFRPQRLEDFCVTSSAMPYLTEFSDAHPSILALRAWLKEAMPDDDSRHYLLKYLASCLQPVAGRRLIHVFTGEEETARVLIKLLRTVFSSIMISSLTEKSANTSAHLAFIEPMEPISLKQIQTWTGGDARRVTRLFCTSDAYFKLKEITHPRRVKNEIRFLPLTTCSEIEVEKMGPALLWLLSVYWPLFCDERMEALQIQDATNEFWLRHDIYFAFAHDHLEEVKDKTIQLKFEDLCSAFCDYLHNRFGASCHVDYDTIKLEFSSRFGRLVDDSWYGIQLKSTSGTLDV